MPDEAKSFFPKPTPPRSVVAPPHPLTEPERQVLYLRLGSRCRHALAPSPFMKALFEALFQAGGEEFTRLESAFPEQSAAVRRWRTDPMFAPLHGTEPR
jgi:hypothetical protein